MGEEKHYKVGERDIIGQGQHYANHVQALTSEDLHEKGDIAAELAHRDIEISKLRDRLVAYRYEVRDAVNENEKLEGKLRRAVRWLHDRAVDVTDTSIIYAMFGGRPDDD